MAKRKCNFCGEFVDKNAVICTSCGTNQKSGKSFKAYNERKKKTFSKKLLILIILGAFLFGAYHFSMRYRSQISELKSGLVTKITKITSKIKGKPEEKPEEKQEKENTVPKETLYFPIDIAGSKDADQYNMSVSGGGLRYKKQIDSSKKITWTMFTYMIVKILPVENIRESLRLKIYRGKNPDGEYELVYDQIKEIKLQKGIVDTFRRDRFERMSKKYDKSPRMKEKFLKAMKALEKRRETAEKKIKPKLCALFSFKGRGYLLEPGQQYLYFRVLLYDSAGKLIKQYRQDRPHRVEVPQQISGKSINRRNNHVQYGMDENTIYPYFSGSTRALKFVSTDKDAFKVTSLSIDGVNYPPIFTVNSGKLIQTRSKGKIVKKTTYYTSSLNLGYPFGGQVKIKFKYKTASGKFKRDGFSFYLPPPPPLIRLETGKQGKVVKIAWDKIQKGIDKSRFFELPTLILKRNYREFKNFPVYQQNTVEDPEVVPGEPISYQLVFKGGIYKAPLWTSKKGFTTYKLQLGQIQNPFMERGVDITVPARSEKAHPVRIELLKTSLCYENTGITACELMNKVLDGVAQEKDMVFYDRKSRDYIIDEKFFALSASLKNQFMIKEADYAVQIRDYSRQDGNGLELWLFKKKIEGTGAIKSTVYWRIADIKIKSDRSEMRKAVEKLIVQIRETLEFRSCPDPRLKNIKPKNIICMPLRPVNQRFVVWNYKAICESLFLSLSEKSNSVKILSRDDWDQLFSERIRRFDEGHSVIENMEREVLLTGRLWRTGKGRTYYIQACDAFSGEVLGARMFSGSLNEVAGKLNVWLEALRLSDDIKVDFQISKFHQRIVKTAYLRPWQPRTTLIKDFAPYISNPQKSWSARKKKGKALRSYKRAKDKEQDAFYSFVKRQWKDGFRAKAVSLLEKDWKGSKSLKSGDLLSSYYVELKRYGDALKLYKAMLKMDGCPISVYKNYDIVMRKSKQPVVAPKPEAKPQKTPEKAAGSGYVRYGSLKMTNAMDYGSVYTSYKNGRAVETRIPKTQISRDDALEKFYFIDRDKICPEWAPNQPCRTAKLVFSLPGQLLSQGINSRTVKKYGVWTKALRMAPENTYDIQYLFMNWRWLPFKPHIKNNRFYTGSASVAAAEERQMRSICKTRIIVFEGGWNSINPFDENLNGSLSYTRLGYFFRLYEKQGGLLNHLYHHSKIRAFFELQKNPRISFPKFTFAANVVRKAFISRIRTGKDMIRYWALELAEQYRGNNKRKLYLRGVKLYQMLALNYIVRHESNSTLRRLYRMIKATPVPTTLQDYSNSQVGTDFLVFMAYKKNRNAVRLLKLMLDKRGYISHGERADYTYVLAQAGYKKLTMKMAPTRGLDAMTLRWLPERILDKVSENSNYLIFGTRNDAAARKWLLGYNTGEVINQYFGKPPAEAYRDWKQEHFKLLEQLKTGQIKENK